MDGAGHSGRQLETQSQTMATSNGKEEISGDNKMKLNEADKLKGRVWQAMRAYVADDHSGRTCNSFREQSRRTVATGSAFLPLFRPRRKNER